MKSRKSLLILTTILCVFSLASCDMTRFGEELTDTILTALIPNFWATLVQLIALIILVVVVLVFAYKPISKFVDERRKFMKDEITNATKNNEESKKNLDKSIEEVAKGKAEATRIIEDAKKEATKEKNKIIASAEVEIDEMKEKAHKEVDNYKAQAEKEIKEQLVDLTIAASSKILEREVSKDDNKKLVDDFINSIEEKH